MKMTQFSPASLPVRIKDSRHLLKVNRNTNLKQVKRWSERKEKRTLLIAFILSDTDISISKVSSNYYRKVSKPKNMSKNGISV